MNSETGRDDYDGPWKQVLERYFPQFLELFFPVAHQGIDWSRGCEFLDKELEKVVRDAEFGRRLADKLVKVYRRDGEEAWVLAHVEVQAQVDHDLSRRMYVYNFRIFDRYGREVASLAVLGDDQASWRPSSFGYDLWGSRVSLEFPTVKLLDWEDRWEELEKNPNPFAVVVMAHLKAIRTRRDPQARVHWKRILFRSLYERGYQREDIIALFGFVDWVLRLPDDLEQGFRDEVARYEEEIRMPYVTSIERLGREDGIHRSILGVLNARFGEVPDSLVEKVRSVHGLETLDELTEKAALVASLDEFEQALPTANE